MNRDREGDDSMRKIAVVFPGIGYTKDRPLLYYSGKQAVRCGYELRQIEFHGLVWDKEKLKDQSFMADTLARCLQMTEEQLADLNDISSDRVVFISKSMGTVVATAYDKSRSIGAEHLCFSPLEMIEPYIGEERGVLFYGDNDPYADYRAIERIADDRRLEKFRISGGNHSLETGDPCEDIDNLRRIIQCVAEKIPE